MNAVLTEVLISVVQRFVLAINNLGVKCDKVVDYTKYNHKMNLIHNDDLWCLKATDAVIT